jgi:hypothetical protein
MSIYKFDNHHSIVFSEDKSSKFSFQDETFEEDFNLNDQDLVKLIPYGVQLAPDGVRPMLLLKDEKGELTLPVALNPLEAGVTLTQSNKSIAPVTPHRVTEILMEGLNISPESCLFVEIRGSHQYVRLNIKGHPDLKFIKVRADEAMSFCLHFNVPIFATKSYIARSRVLVADTQGQAQGILANPQILTKNHKYMM